ncbi:MAG TPA: pyridoxal phosphate-dependent aminotransferase [Candidatus Polarisedimenticolaceae bacterium]|nr:pyridoxal phosphate-dependent aminotransferase [Candidatus Polarisedimenticolaceae bacterium]
MFSRRIPHDLSPNTYAAAKAKAAIAHDLTISNPTAAEIEYPRDLLAALASPAGLAYRPDPKGLRKAREAVGALYGADPDRIVLTASSSEAYGFLFKLLCDPGDAVYVPSPSYPLFEHLAALDGVAALPYPLDGSHRWQPVPQDPSRAKAAIVVHPNNPTGSFVDRETADTLAPGLPLIVDEVFLDYAWGSSPTSFATRDQGLTFTLGGLSKSCGLPQLKLSWIVASGPEQRREAALEKLEFVGDNYLSVATPVQEALPEILRRAAPVREAIRARCLANLAAARALLPPGGAVELLPPEGGWTAVVRFPRVVAEEALVLELLSQGVAVHPGYFFDFPADGYLVVSLLPPPSSFAAGLRTVIGTIEAAV